jgi:ribosome-binding factor A
VRDPRVREVTVTRAEVTDDLREARIFWVPLAAVQSEERIEELSKGLKAAAAFLQHRVGQELKLRFTPRLRFSFDRGIENLVRVHDLLEGITKDGSEE